jgi:hypothetical protein
VHNQNFNGAHLSFSIFYFPLFKKKKGWPARARAQASRAAELPLTTTGGSNKKEHPQG